MMRRKPRRRGFAMLLVLLVVTVILGSWGVAARHAASMIRVEQARASRIRRDAARRPALKALARALAVLEIGHPPASPYTCSVVEGDGGRFAVRFARDPEDTACWTVEVTPGADDALPPLDESSFGVAPPGPPG